MGRLQKITPLEVFEDISNNERSTISDLADKHGVCKQTIRNKVKILRDDGEKIIFDTEGLFILEKIRNEDDFNKFKNYQEWVLSTMIGLARCGKVTRPLLKDSKEYLRNKLSRDERKVLSKYTVQISKLLDYIEFEEELENDDER